MKITMYTFAAFTALTATAALADPQTDRAQLVGSWVESNGADAWVIESQPAGLHITQIEGSDPVADFQCNTEGESCNVKVAGHKATVTMYYNGPALVQMETRGDKVVKRRFSIVSPGNSMKVEVTSMNGASPETQELEFERGQPATRKK
jgi:hypothetical protein